MTIFLFSKNTEKLETAEILRLLIQHSSLSDLDIKDSEGRSPLIWAASVGSERAVDILIAAGASVATSDNAGLSGERYFRSSHTCLLFLSSPLGSL